MTLRQSQRWTLHLVDDADRRNKQPPEFVITVTANQYPTVELASPSRDVEVSPLEELQLSARVWDDYGLTRFGLTYQIGDGTEQEVVLGQNTSSKDKIAVEHLMQFEELSLEPAQLFAYHFWAEDQTADGKPRRAVSNMYFAEVRPFDESYRQGQQPAGGAPDQRQQQPGQTPGGEGSQAQQLAQEQKNIINATWNLLRTELGETISPAFVDDVRVIRESQSALINKLQELVQQLQDETAHSQAGKVADHMQHAVTQLTRAIDEQSREALREAVAPEQAAYQALLKLRAREHEVVRSQSPAEQQSRSGSGSGSSRSQQQLQQLALSNDENRYETERQAQQQTANGSEDRQVLNRLRELARRQSDLNERLQELQAELQQAQTEPEREELRKQLKRLREQQEEILRDTDELNSRVQNNPSQSELSETQQRLEQAREQVRRASQALEEGQVSQALTSGSRAQRELDELHEEFRRKTSDRFVDQARELTRQAQELAAAEQKVAETLNPQSEEQEQSLRSLRENSPREQVLEELQRQDERLEELLQNMQTTVQESEQPQPLLAEQLYDSYRRVRQDRLPENLQEARQSLQRGLVEDARQLERTAREGIERLRDDVQQAADSVLGDENEALQRARDELDTLAQQVDREIREADAPGDTGQNEPDSDGNPQADSRDEPRDADLAKPGSTGEENPSESRDGQVADTPRRLRGGAERDTQPAEETGGGEQNWQGPLTGNGFRDWSDRLRDVEEMISDPELRQRVGQVRDRAREVRTDLIRHSQSPNWELVRTGIARPLQELRNRLDEELQKRASQKALVPIDRDPVPAAYEEQVRRYYERLGSGQ
jgi:myosin heavy subunit